MNVCAYCRVSTDKDDQLNSLHNQQDYFESYIKNHDDWTLVRIFADEGISGTSTKKRVAFNEMIKCCENGEIDLILTKEVSRFARNTVDTLEYTRRLKRYGVGVLFINDNIDTRQNDGEFRLSIMASVAQEESRKTSERVKWGQKRSMERGVVFGNDSLFGYTTKNGALYVKEEEAEIVRSIYSKFINEGKGTHVIARELYEEGIDPPKSSSKKWSGVMILRILRNEKYVGDLLQKKEITVDYLTHKKVINRDIEDKIYLRDHHEAIIDRDTWNRAQQELSKRKPSEELKTKYSNRYWCSGKIKCGCCGSRFVLRRSSRPNNQEYKAWACHNRAHYGNWKRNDQGDEVGCNMRMLNDKSLTTCVQYVVKQLHLENDTIVHKILSDLNQTMQGMPVQGSIRKFEDKKRVLQDKKERVMDAYFSETISQDEMISMKQRYDMELEKINLQIEEIQNAEQTGRQQRENLSQLEDLVRSSMTDSESVYREIIEEIIVKEDSVLIQVKYLPFYFELHYSTHGYKENYTTVIEQCELVSLENRVS